MKTDDLNYGGDADPDLSPGKAWEGDGGGGVAFNLDGRMVFITTGDYDVTNATPEDWKVAEYLIGLVKKDRTGATS